MERGIGRRWRQACSLLAIAGFAFLFVGYGAQLEPVYGDSFGDRPARAGDVWIKDARGNWVPQTSATKRGATAPRTNARAPRRTTTRVPTAAKTSGGAMSATAFAHAHHLKWEDHGTYGVLHDGTARIRLYENKRNALVMREHKMLREPITRRNGTLMLPACVVTYLARETSAERHAQQQVSARQRAAAAAAHQRMLAAARAPKPLPRLAQPKPAPIRPVVKPAPPPAARPAARVQPDAGWAPGIGERKWKWIILHHSDDTSGNAAKYDRVHRYENGWEHGLGYHFVIGNGTESKDGQVEVGPRWRKQLHGAHAKTPDNRFNDYGIGICLVGDFDTGSRRPTTAQMDQLVRLVRWLRDRYGISVHDVQGHCDCCPTACPGRHFPWDELRRRIR